MRDQSRESSQAQNNDVDPPIIIPASKLDADQYSADDLDGITESVFGSGNMAYASLQASQTDAALNVQSGRDRPNASAQSIDTDRSIGQSDGGDLQDMSDGNFSSSTVGSISASQLSSDSGAFAPAGSGLSFEDGLGVRQGIADVPEGDDQANRDVEKSTGGQGAEDRSDNMSKHGNAEHHITINTGDVIFETGDITFFVDNSFIQIGDIINTFELNLGDTIQTLNTINLTENNDLSVAIDSVSTVTKALIKTVNSMSENITDIVHDITIALNENAVEIGDISSALSQLNGLGIFKKTVSNFENTTQNIEGVVSKVIHKASTLVSEINNNIADTLDQQIVALTEITQTLVETIDVAVETILDGVGDITGMQTGLDGNILTQGDVLGDGIITNTLDPIIDLVTGIDDLDLGPVIDVFGDIIGHNTDNNMDATDSDITADVGLDILQHQVIDAVADVVIDPVEDLTGDIDIDAVVQTDVLNSADTDNTTGDSDVTVTPDIDIVNMDILDGEADIQIDFIETITGIGQRFKCQYNW